jgi:transposase
MIGRQERHQDQLFIAGQLRDLIPDDHILKRVDKVLDLSWLRHEVKDLYDEHMGRKSIDPEAAVRLMLAGLFEGIVHDRKLMRQAQVNIAIRWFAGYRLDEALPDHSSLTKIRQRWGEERFKKIFLRTVQLCLEAGLIDGETVHIDATLIRADVSWQSLTTRHVEAVLEANGDTEGPTDPEGGKPKRRQGRPPTKKPKPKKYSPTDPDATMATSCKQYRLEPCYKQHTAVDDKAGVIVDVAVTTGEASEGEQLPDQIDRIEANTGRTVKTATADAAYAHSRNYMEAESRGIDAVIPPQSQNNKPKRIPVRRFKYDGKHKIVRCPGGKVLQRSSYDSKRWVYRARAADCRACQLRPRCFSQKGSARTISISHGYESLLRARRRRPRWGDHEYGLYRRHRWRSEGVHGEAKTQHGLRRAARRGRPNVAIQAYLTAAVMNLKRLAALASTRPARANDLEALANRLLALLAAHSICQRPGNLLLRLKPKFPAFCLRESPRYSAAA